MISYRRFKVVCVTLIVSSAFILSSCRKQSNDDSKKHSDTSSDVQTHQSSDLQSLRSNIDLTKVPVENKMEDSLRRVKDQNYLEIAQKILKEKPKFRSMVKKCSPGNRSDEHITKYGAYGRILLFPSPVEPGVYLVGLQCTTAGRCGNEYRFFTYTDNQGISLEQLKFTDVGGQKGDLQFREETYMYSQGFEYDPSKKELSFTYSCSDSGLLFCSSGKYRYENESFILSEYWNGVSKKPECVKKKLYP
jgi:hypothetical protein